MEILETNKLYILSGVPGSGKSTFLKKNNIPEHMIVSSDAIREQLLGKSFDFDKYGVYESLSEDVNGVVFDIVKMIIETKLKEGQTVFFDATNTTDYIRKDYVKLADKYNIESEILIFGSKLSINEIKENNKNRSKRVPEIIIEKFYEKMENSSKFKHRIISFEEQYSLVPKFNIDENIDLSIIGDIHGLYDELENLLSQDGFYIEDNIIKHQNPNKKVLFLGDIIDRGVDSIKMLELVKNSIKKENHYMILGNHENKLLNIYNKYIEKKDTGLFNVSEAVSRTFSEFLKLPVKQQEKLINFYKKLPFYYIYKDNLIVHANISHSDINTLTRSYCIYGSKSNKTDLSYHNLYKNGINKYKLIRGHIPINDINSSVISLERDGIDGGDICMYNIPNKKLFTYKCSFNYSKDSKFYKGRKLILKLNKLKDYKLEKINKNGDVVGFKNTPLISYKDDITGTMRIYKYSKRVFFDNLWNIDQLLLKARGLVLDGNGNIVQHPFDKVFNYGENNTGIDIPDEKKVLAVEKLNGFLGCITYHNNQLLITTTGSFDSIFVEYIKDFFANKNFRHFDSNLKTRLIKFLRNENLTLMFEVIHPDDPHIIKYEAKDMGLKLIGARGKEFDSKELSEKRLDSIAKEIGVDRAEYFEVKFGELKNIVKDSNLEGYMVRDLETTKTLLKFKTPYYLTTKFIGRMSESNIDFMYSNPYKFKEKVDEEYYSIVDAVVENISKEDFLNMDNQNKIDYVRNLITTSRNPNGL